MTKEGYIKQVELNLIRMYPWAQEPAKLECFINRLRETLNTSHNLTNIDGPAFIEAWKTLGGKAKPTYKALRRLP